MDTKYDYDYDFTAYFSSELEFSRIISVCDVRYSETKDGPAISVDDMYEGDYPEYRRYSISSFESISIEGSISSIALSAFLSLRITC